MVIPDGFKVESLKQFLPPTRIEQKVHLLEHGSFCDYVNRFKSEDTLVFASVGDAGAAFVSVLDYHAAKPMKPSYASHVALFEVSPTAEWRDWMLNNGLKKDQVEFATFLEEHGKLIVAPPGAELLELVQNLQGKNDARFSSGIRLQSGQVKLHYDEDVVLKGTSTSKPGEIELPKEITAGIAPFQGTEPYQVSARLKFRIENRKLALWYETIAPHRIVRDAIKGIIKAIGEKTGITPLIGRL